MRSDGGGGLLMSNHDRGTVGLSRTTAPFNPKHLCSGGVRDYCIGSSWMGHKGGVLETYPDSGLVGRQLLLFLGTRWGVRIGPSSLSSSKSKCDKEYQMVPPTAPYINPVILQVSSWEW